VPGVTDYGAQNAGGNQFGTTFSVNGTRTNQDSFYLDGAFDSSLFITGGNLLPNPDALLEFRLLTNNFDAEFGRFPGGVVNVVTRSGGNAFHGSLYDYLRNNVLNSKNYFQTTITPLKQNQFGGTFGGPILHDKAFFFGSYEGLRILTPTIIAPTSISTPTPAEAGGDFSALSPANQPNVSCNGVHGVICPNQLDPVAQALLKQVPLANSTTGLTPQQSAAGNTTANQYLIRLDYAWTKSHQLSGTFFQSLSDSENANQGGNQILAYSGGQSTDNQTNVAISDVWTISPNKLNTFRPFYTLNHYNLTNLYNGNVGWLPYGSPTGLGALPATQPQIAINGYFTMGMGSGGPDDLRQQSFGAEDTFNWDLGNHLHRILYGERPCRFPAGQSSYFPPEQRCEPQSPFPCAGAVRTRRLARDAQADAEPWATLGGLRSLFRPEQLRYLRAVRSVEAFSERAARVADRRRPGGSGRHR
jgi:hypothetical protein